MALLPERDKKLDVIGPAFKECERSAQGTVVQHCGGLVGGEGEGAAEGLMKAATKPTPLIEWLPPAAWVQFWLATTT